MTEKKTFDFLDIKVECMLISDGVPEEYDLEALGGVYGLPIKDNPTTFRIWIRGLVREYVLVHEVWHLFFAIMKHIDRRNHTFEELYTEIYAYNFHILYCNVLEAFTRMKLYHRLWEDVRC